VEQAAGGVRRAREVVGLLDLMQDLGLADDHRVERGDHAEQVLHDRVPLDHVQVAGEFMAVEIVELAQEVDDGVRAGVRRGDRVDLGTVAGREDDRFRDLIATDQRGQRLRLHVRREGELLADRDRSGLVGKTDEGQMHAVRVLPSYVGARSSGSRTKGRPRRSDACCSGKRARRGRCRPRCGTHLISSLPERANGTTRAHGATTKAPLVARDERYSPRTFRAAATSPSVIMKNNHSALALSTR